MVESFHGNLLPLLIGSLPVGDHKEAFHLVTKYTPEIPLWVQLPIYQEEQMIPQFLPGMPGWEVSEDKSYINASDESFNDKLVEFFEEYMEVMEHRKDIDQSRFAMKPDTARGFYMMMEEIDNTGLKPRALKGQITGPITFTTGVKDNNGRAIFYDDQVRDAAVKLLALKARWQVIKLSRFRVPVIIFLDEPALAGFGSSEFISMSKEEVLACFNEVTEAVHHEGGMAGIHVCANSDWSLVFESTADILSFDAYSYFDKFILYKDQLKAYLNAGRKIAWGIVPTSDPADIDRETVESLSALWEEKASQIDNLGFDRNKLIAQSFITPSCGTGSLSREHAVRVMELTRDVSRYLRNQL